MSGHSRLYESLVTEQLAKDITAIAESYKSWKNLSNNINEFGNLVADRLSEYGLDGMED